MGLHPSSFDHLATCTRNPATEARAVRIETGGQPEIVARHPGPFPGRIGREPGDPFPDVYGVPPDDVVDAEVVDPSDAPERDAKGRGPLRKVAGLIGYFRRPDLPSPEREKIWKAIYRAGEPIGPKDISQRTKMKPGNVRKLLNAMLNEGTVTRAGYGKYTVTGK